MSFSFRRFNQMNSADFYYYAPAKVNFSLKIGNKIQNNLHKIQSLMRKIKIFDKISFNLTHGDCSITAISGKMLKGAVSGHDLALLSAKENIIIKAAKIYFERLNITDKGVDVLLEKNIPLKGGLGGGSSDAAGMFLKLNEIFNYPLNTLELQELALKTGSDVPFFLTEGDAVITGVGENIQAIPGSVLPKYYIVLIIPNFGLSTKEVYNDFDDFLLTNSANYYNIQYLDFKNIKFENDFETVVFKKYPILREIRDYMMQYGAELSLLSGSGSTVFGAFRDKKKAVTYIENLTSFPFNKRLALSSLTTTL